MKFFVFLRGSDRAERASFKAMVIDRLAPRLAAANPAPTHLVVNIVDRTPQRLPYLPITVPGTKTNADHDPPYDAILQIWFRSQADLQQATASWPDTVAAAHRYAVTEATIWDREAEATGRRPGIRYFGLVHFHDDLPESALRRSWAHHTNLARRAHPAATRYHQNWIDARIDPSAPAAGGISALYFPTEREAFDRFFDSDRGRDEITHETGHFIKGGPRFYTTEHVFK